MNADQAIQLIAQQRKPPPENDKASGQAGFEAIREEPTSESVALAQKIGNTPCGATQAEWAHFDLLLGLTADLLPVVSNPAAVISQNSNMNSLGKTPSIYNGNRQVAGLPQWTQRQSTGENIDAWMKEKDYGLCVQTRTVRGLDVDISEPEVAQRVRSFVADFLALQLPCRMRSNAAKFLLAFELPGVLPKRRMKVSATSMIELLGTGQQFIAAGLHPSGVRYEWEDGLPSEIPALTLEQVDALWQALANDFAIEAPSASTASTKAKVLANAIHNDPTAQHLYREGFVLKEEADGRLHITCPFEGEHGPQTSISSTTYFPAHTGGYDKGHFDCKHGHCEEREDQEFLGALGLLADDFGDLSALPDVAPDMVPASDTKAPERRRRFEAVQIGECIRHRPPLRYLIKNIIPHAELVVMFGDSGSGKTFMALDMAMAVARGIEWRGKKVHQGRVVYVAAEDYYGVCDRAQAYAHQHEVNLDALPFAVINAAPNLLLKLEALEVAKEIGGGAALVVIDTFAKSMPGGEENGGKDMGLALSHCKGIHRATGAVVLMIHHSGKDPSKGARGWSGLRAAADAELEIIRGEGDGPRAMTTKKQKNGPDGESFGFSLLPVWLGEDDDGEDITSCVVEHNNLGRPSRTGRRRGPNEEIAVRVLRENGDMTEGDLIASMVEQMVRDPNAKDGRRNNAKRAINGLIGKGIFCKLGSLVSFPSSLANPS